MKTFGFGQNSVFKFKTKASEDQALCIVAVAPKLSPVMVRWVKRPFVFQSGGRMLWFSHFARVDCNRRRSATGNLVCVLH